MNILIPLSALILSAALVTPVHSRSVTFYADGAIVEQEATAAKGIIEIPLPASMIDGSLRVIPLRETSLQRVDFSTSRTDSSRSEKELETLLEQRNRLEDRLQALTTREEIFKSAAKSQSGKAPRKTKANPDPLQAIRQGTEFAIAQLEAVYTARRKTEQEIRRIDSRISAAKSTNRGTDSTLRVLVTPLRGKALIHYALALPGWAPAYDLFLEAGDSALFHLSGQFNGAFDGYLLRASPATLAERSTARVVPLRPGQSARLASFRLPVSEKLFGPGIRSSFSFVLKNTEQKYLPGGETNLYNNGVFVGRFRFEGMSSGRSRFISVGM